MIAADLWNRPPLFSGRSIYFATFCHLSLFQLGNYVPIMLHPMPRGGTHAAFQPAPLPSPPASPPKNHKHYTLIHLPQPLDPKTRYNQCDSAVKNASTTPHIFTRHLFLSSPFPSFPVPSPSLSSLPCRTTYTQPSSLHRTEVFSSVDNFQ